MNELKKEQMRKIQLRLAQEDADRILRLKKAGEKFQATIKKVAENKERERIFMMEQTKRNNLRKLQKKIRAQEMERRRIIILKKRGRVSDILRLQRNDLRLLLRQQKSKKRALERWARNTDFREKLQKRNEELLRKTDIKMKLNIKVIILLVTNS